MNATTSWTLVTGAARGIGRAIVSRLLADDTPVVGLDSNTDGLEKLAREKQGRPLTVHPFDLTATDMIPALMTELSTIHGYLAGLVNNAGIFPGGPITAMTDKTWNEVVSINLTAPFALMRAAAPAMGPIGGAIVNIASRNAFRSSTNNAAYDASKAGLVALTRTAAGEFADLGIRVNAVCPGVVETPGEAALSDRLFNEAYKKQIPLDRYGKADEIAGVVRFLLGPDASYITGEALVVDGGQLAC